MKTKRVELKNAVALYKNDDQYGEKMLSYCICDENKQPVKYFDFVMDNDFHFSGHVFDTDIDEIRKMDTLDFEIDKDSIIYKSLKEFLNKEKSVLIDDDFSIYEDNKKTMEIIDEDDKIKMQFKNIKEQRFSRNPRIGRVLYEMGFVRELNEGVKRIYSSMDEYRLDEPYYTDENDIVTLKLVNASYGNDKNISRDVLEKIAKNYKEYNATKKAIIDRLLFRGDCTLDEIEKANKSGLRAIQNNIKDLIDDGIVVRYSEKIRDKNAIYGITKPLSEHYKNGSNRG